MKVTFRPKIGEKLAIEYDGQFSNSKKSDEIKALSVWHERSKLSGYLNVPENLVQLCDVQ
jgi:hypothetical protein